MERVAQDFFVTYDMIGSYVFVGKYYVKKYRVYVENVIGELNC